MGSWKITEGQRLHYLKLWAEFGKATRRKLGTPRRELKQHSELFISEICYGCPKPIKNLHDIEKKYFFRVITKVNTSKNMQTKCVTHPLERRTRAASNVIGFEVSDAECACATHQKLQMKKDF